MHRESPNFGHLVVVLVFFSGFTETKKIEVEFGLSAQIDFKSLRTSESVKSQIKELPFLMQCALLISHVLRHMNRSGFFLSHAGDAGDFNLKFDGLEE